GAEDQVSCERRAYGNVGGLEVTNLADHDDIGVLTHDMAQPRGECQTNLRIDVNLIDPVHLIFNRIFDRDDLPIGNIDALQGTVQSGAFTAARRTRDQKYTVRFGRHLADLFV